MNIGVVKAGLVHQNLTQALETLSGRSVSIAARRRPQNVDASLRPHHAPAHEHLSCGRGAPKLILLLLDP